MATSVNQVLVSVADRAAMFRLRGRATAKESTGFKAAADGLRSRSLAHFVIDLTECESMDSTFIGVLTGLSRRVHRDAGAAGKVELVNPTAVVRRQLDDLFVLDQFTVSECPLAPAGFEQVPTGTTNKAELCRLMLEAHQTLMDANAANVPKFKQVAEFLEEDLKHLGS